MPAAALGRWPGGSRAAGVMGKREVGPWGVDSPLQFHGRGSAGRGAAAMVVAASGGHGRRRQGWLGVSGRGEKEEGGPGHLPRPLA